MTNLVFLTKLCKISTKLKKTTEYCGVHCYADNVTVKEITNDGCVIVDENELHELFQLIRQIQRIVRDEIEEVTPDAVEELEQGKKYLAEVRGQKSND